MLIRKRLHSDLIPCLVVLFHIVFIDATTHLSRLLVKTKHLWLLAVDLRSTYSIHFSVEVCFAGHVFVEVWLSAFVYQILFSFLVLESVAVAVRLVVWLLVKVALFGSLMIRLVVLVTWHDIA